MMVQALCNTCFQVYEIRVEPDDAHLLRKLVDESLLAECPRLCGGKINMRRNEQVSMLANDPRLKPPLPLTVNELFKAVNGAGLPDEVPTSTEVVEALLQLHKVTDVVTSKDSSKVYVHELHLENGAVIHLASGIRGALVLKITKKEK